MARIYVDEYDKVAAIVRGDSPDECGLFQCQQRLFAWCSAAFVLKRQRDEALAKIGPLEQMGQGVDHFVMTKHKTERTNERLRRGLAAIGLGATRAPGTPHNELIRALERIRVEATRLLNEEAE